MTQAELNEILRLHGLWLQVEEGGARADLSRADLSGTDLYGTDLSGANLSGANLSRANLSGANLSRANLSRANLSRADLSGTDLSGANLSRADLSRANLSRADLCEADLSRANLSRADLSRAIGIHRLPVSDPRGYRHLAVWCGDGWRVYAGCRNFTEAEARAHWVSDSYDGPASVGETMAFALDWLEKQPTPERKP